MKRIGICLVALGLLTSCLTAQPFQEPFPIGPGGQGFPPGGQGFPGGPNGPGGFPGGQGFPPGGFSFPGMSQERKILKTYDKNKNKILDLEERKIARAVMVLENNRGGFGGRRPGGMGPQTTGTPGPKVTVEGAKLFPGKDLYDLATLRTLFLDFESPDWEKELEEFHGTDVDVPAKFTFEGNSLKGRVGVHFRGMSSYMGVQAGSKRSFSVSLDLEDSKQRVMGVKTLNLLNSHEDASMMSTVLYSQIANKHLPTPKANFVKVVINGESWGVYVNVEQFNKEFVASRFKPLAGGTKPARWKVRGSPGGGGGLEYLGENPEDYKRRFELKSGNDEKAWKDLINLCKILNQTPVDKLEEAIKPILDVDQLLWFLALDVALINTDGYWIRASDFSIYKDERGVFHIVPHDMNEAFRQPMGPGMGRPPGGRPGMEFPKPGEILSEGLQKELKLSPPQISALANLQKETDERMNKLLDGNQRQQFLNMRNMRPGMPGGFGGTPPGGPGRPGGPGGPGRPGGPGGMMPMNIKGVELDPLVGLEDPRKPLRSKILAVPAFRQKYLQNIHLLAKEDISWEKIGAQIATLRALIEKEVKDDTRKLEGYNDFLEATAAERRTTPAVDSGNNPGGQMRRGPTPIPLREFAEKRSRYLLENAEVKKSIQGLGK